MMIPQLVVGLAALLAPATALQTLPIPISKLAQQVRPHTLFE
jgi:hypothetical protein